MPCHTTKYILLYGMADVGEYLREVEMIFMTTLGNVFPRIFEECNTTKIAYFSTTYGLQRQAFETIKKQFPSYIGKFAIGQYNTGKMLPSILFVNEVNLLDCAILKQKVRYDIAVYFQFIGKITNAKIIRKISTQNIYPLLKTVDYRDIFSCEMEVFCN